MSDPNEQEVLAPESRLKDKVPVRGTGTGVDLSAITRAEQALGDMAGEFDHWIEEEVTILCRARDAIRVRGYSGEPVESLRHAAHDLKGQGVTFGYPLATRISASLCQVIDSDGAHIEAALIGLVDHHVDAIRAVVRDRLRGEGNATALSLVQSLLDASTAYLAAIEPKQGDGADAARPTQET